MDRARSPWARLILDEIENKRTASGALVFTDEEEKAHLTALVEEADRPLPEIRLGANAKLKTVMQICTTSKVGVYSKCLIWDGGFPRFAAENGDGRAYVARGSDSAATARVRDDRRARRSRDEPARAQVAGILAARETPFWLAFLAATLVYRRGGRACETEDGLPDDVVEDRDVDRQYRRFLRFVQAGLDDDDDPRHLSLFEGMGYRVFLVGEDLAPVAVAQREHAVLRGWPALPTTLDAFVDVEAKWRRTFRPVPADADDLYKHIVSRVRRRRAHHSV